MKLNYSFLFIIPLALICASDNMFTELAAPKNLNTQASLLNLIIKGSSALAFLYSTFYFKRMSPFMRFAFGLTTLYLLAMMFESYYYYNSIMIYPHVFQRILFLYYIYFVYTFYKGNYHLKFSHVVWFILAAFWLNVIIVNPHTLSISSFTNHNRGVHSTSVYMLVVPFLYFLSRYLYKGGFFDLFMSLFVLLNIFFFQHRTVWVSTAMVLVVYYLLIRFKGNEPINFVGRLMPVATVMVILGIASSAFLFSEHPEIIDKVQESISDIENMDSQGTGGWRYQQWLSYLPFIEENFMFGMRNEGFELPIQFYRDDIDQPVFEDGNGHHFHSFYVDILFYIGFAGLLLFCLAALYVIWKSLTKRSITDKEIILVSFVSTGFVFGISYVLPAFYYAFLGWAIATVEEERIEHVTYLKAFAQRRKANLIALKEKLISS
ncbi:O-antigen ligase [Pontibacter sp. SGAir0037]|uniref:O-antigen ligase family protein n=1 Tax=Pontibacter sp. SGAir0037 TaxID=2571030 RepID=UPI0010CD05FE|nr:O-antigen ligase family protein [Pontibacter sp. SGAir0037]QCR22814.1 hypothetical protein C1N53_10985 [Pontibacter sp. SGAir0037]